ncbi:prevent-host-death family protein [Meiothermus luteus]|jgi:prevent-host-death family protein|uniref:Antitoxin n=1 Tax=Meiothermus luteus TaxID=2026184 RepID=A0A399EUG4_9DEIN|nr:type II toxin-antitoxin system prevent-host-death family antitoxin [Meiothermus luteus]RIH88264.1 prevent-host-death family protein [Meiothermus luteus]
MRSVSVSEAKNRLSLLLDWVRQGEEVLILDRGTPVARLSPVPPASGEALGLLERSGLVRRGSGRAVLAGLPWPKARSSALEALLSEREEGR